MLTGSSDLLYLQQISKKKLEFTSAFLVFSLFVRSSTLLTAFWLSICYPSLAELHRGLKKKDF